MQQTFAKKSLPSLRTKENLDENAVFLTSAHDFFEVFAMKPQILANILIPSTLIFEDSQKLIVFNEFSNKTLRIKTQKLENTGFFARVLKARAISQGNSKKKLSEALFEALKRFVSVIFQGNFMKFIRLLLSFAQLHS